jgi:hypothetical protein
MTFSPRDLGWAALIGAATLVANGTPLNNAVESGLVAWLGSTLQFGLPAVLFVRLADAAVDVRRLPAWLAYPAGVVATVLLGVWVTAPALQPVLGRPGWWTSFNDAMLASTTLVWHALGVAVYVQMRSSHHAQARLLGLQARARAHQRELAGARLAALQARVEPELLFERLQCIHAELAVDAPTARTRLQALIDLLRALQPHQQAAASTLCREIDALRAYATLVGADARLQCAAPGPKPGANWPAWPAWPVAPMVLLPLLRTLLADGTSTWRLTLHSARRHAELRMQGTDPDAARAQAASERVALPALNDRLRAVHGAGATITLQPGVGAQPPAFTLRWPVPAHTATPQP